MNVFVTLALILALVVAGGIAVALSGRVRWAQPLQDPVSTVPPVLLPAHPRAQDLAQLRFATGLRGYRMDQVDDLLTALGEKYGFAPTISQLTENSVVLDTNVLTEGEATDGSNEAAHR